MRFLRKLPIPQEIKNEYPADPELQKKKKAFDSELCGIFEGKSDKLLLVIGPCSADNEEAVLEYTLRLKSVYDQVRESLFIVPRIYTNKPRSAGVGYMGMIHSPDPEGEEDLLSGLVASRRLFINVALESGMFPADEILYPENYRYFSDILSYVTVGARSVENQQHRLTASGIEVPVGMKNPLSGDLQAMAYAVRSAREPHKFLYRGWEVQTKGNRYAHGILRGYTDRDGNVRPNYFKESLLSALRISEGIDGGSFHPSLVVDCSHGNSDKNYLLQPEIAFDVLRSREANGEIKKSVKGLMIESYLYDGSRTIGSGMPGCSITDPCLGFEKTRELIYRIADKLK